MATSTAPTADTGTEQKRQPPYHVIVLNDSVHSMEFVAGMFQRVLGWDIDKAHRVMMQVHQQGRAVVWTGAREVAELKQEQITTCHEHRGCLDLGPVDCVIEPAA